MPLTRAASGGLLWQRDDSASKDLEQVPHLEPSGSWSCEPREGALFFLKPVFCSISHEMRK